MGGPLKTHFLEPGESNVWPVAIEVRAGGKRRVASKGIQETEGAPDRKRLTKVSINSPCAKSVVFRQLRVL